MIWDLILKGKITLVMQHKMKYCLKGQLHWEEEKREFKQAQYFFFLFPLGSPKVERISPINLVPSKSNTKLGKTEKVISVMLSVLC